MPAYLTPPGAWLSGLTPIGPPSSAHTPIGPPGSGHTPIGPPRAAAAPLPTPAPFPMPWDGIDPAWTYGSRSALLGQALRKSNAKITRSGDSALTRKLVQGSAATGAPVDGSHLWRWAPEFRISAVQCELLGRFQVHERSLWMIDSGEGCMPQPIATPLLHISLPPLDKLYGDQVDKVVRSAVEREDRLPEILSQSEDFWPFFESIVGISLDTAPRLTELLAVAHGLTLHLLMALKHNVAARRPWQCSTLVMPVIATPGHGSLPSGHATMSALDAALLGSLLYPPGHPFADERRRKLDRLARRIAFNRVVAGVHFPVDSVVGYALGMQIARLLLVLAGKTDARKPALVDETAFRAIDAKLELREHGTPPEPTTEGDYRCTVAPAFAELWRRTEQELLDLRV